MNNTTIKRLKVVAILIGFFAISLLLYGWLAGMPMPETRDQFVSQWRVASDTERQEILPWLLNDGIDRNKVYEVDQTRLSGLSMQEVERLLGTPDRYWDGESTMYRNYLYGLGAIGKWSDPIGYNIVGWIDYLKISFDENDLVVYIEIIS